MNHLLPNPVLEPYGEELTQWISVARRKLGPTGFLPLLDSLATDVFEAGVREVGATEGTVWIFDDAEKALIPVFNTGPRAADFVGRFVQPLNRGLISMVFENQLAFCESDMETNPRRDSSLDHFLGVRTGSMLAAPLGLAGTPLGVISAVKLADVMTPAEVSVFEADAIKDFERLAEVLQRIWEWQLMRLALGLSDR